MEKQPGARTSHLAKQEEIELEEDEGCINPVPVMIHIEDREGGREKEDQEDDSDGGGEDDGIGSDGDVSSRTHSSPRPSSRQSPVSGYVGKEKKAQSKSKSSNTKQQKLGKQGSSQGSVDSCSSLSRDSSTETYTDSTGIDLQQFIINTLHKNQKDRMMLLRIEQDVTSLIKDAKRQSHKFPQMSSYHRMLVHRVAAFFGLDHNVDQNGTAVIVNKTKNTRIPETKFQDHIRDELMPLEPKKSILKRDSASFEEGKEEDTVEGLQSSSQEDIRWTSEPRPWSSTDSDSSGKPNKQGIKVEGNFKCEGSSQYTTTINKIPLLVKSESETKDLSPPVEEVKPVITKASSFGGISAPTREVPVEKISLSQSFKSESINTPVASSSYLPSKISLSLPVVATQTSVSPTNQISMQLTSTNPSGHSDPAVPYSSQPLMWTIPNVDSLPPGTVIMNPQLGIPYVNPDGSLFRCSLPGTQQLMVTPIAQVPATSSNQQVPGSVPSATLPRVQQQVALFSPNPAIIYIPCIPTQFQQPTQPTGQVISDHRPPSLTQDRGTVRIQDLTAQMSNLSFSQLQPPNQMHVSEAGPTSILSGNLGLGGTTTTTVGFQSYLIPAPKPQNTINLQQCNQQQLQSPLFLVQQPSRSSFNHSLKYVYAPTSMVPSGLQQTLPPGTENISVAHQPLGEVTGPQAVGSLIPGQQFIGHYSGVNLTFNSRENAILGGAPYITSRISGNSTVSITTSSFSPTTHSYNVYPYGSMFISNIPSGTSAHTSQSPEFMSSSVSAMPLCVLTPSGIATPISQSPLPQFTGGAVASSFPNFHPQTPPSQNGSQGTSVPFMGYSVLSPQPQIHPPNPTNLTPSTSSLSTCARFAPNFMSNLPSYHPGFPLGRNVTNSISPPQQVLSSQYSIPLPGVDKRNNNMVLGKPMESSGREQSGQNLVPNIHDHGTVNRVIPFQQGKVSDSSVHRKGGTLLHGLPLHHQFNPLMLQSSQPMVRFPHVTSGQISTVNRQPKVHRQRSRGGNVSSNRSVSSIDNSPILNDRGSSQFLEVEGLPDGMKRYDVERYLEPVTALGAKIEFVCTNSSRSKPLGNDNITKTKYQVLAIFESSTAAQTALLKIKTNKFQLRQRGKEISFKTLS
ncbi:uncharacterized protein LOC143255253 isoform X2 [Tachypleus tridentatus]|uniref:uncharacterized protein LOC143255253 isoform X2 n=1 Tax=Tachypleus tridentatus TaxID=6853 RepID=UPI003FD632CB